MTVVERLLFCEVPNDYNVSVYHGLYQLVTTGEEPSVQNNYTWLWQNVTDLFNNPTLGVADGSGSWLGPPFSVVRQEGNGALCGMFFNPIVMNMSSMTFQGWSLANFSHISKSWASSYDSSLSANHQIWRRANTNESL